MAYPLAERPERPKRKPSEYDDKPIGTQFADEAEKALEWATSLPVVRPVLQTVGGALRVGYEKIIEPMKYESEQLLAGREADIPSAVVGSAVRAFEFGTKTGEVLGAEAAKALNVDPRIGSFLGGGVAETVMTAGAGTVARKAIKAIDTLTPPGAGGLVPAMAGISPQIMPSNGGVRLELPNVMEARLAKRRGGRGDFLEQEQYDVVRPERINAVRDKLDETKEVIQNIEENNPGVKKGVLTATNKEYKRAKENLEDLEALLSSEESNIVAPQPGKEWSYPPNMPRAKEIKAAENDIRGTMEAFELHHLIPKGISAAMMNRVRGFIDEGIATVDDLKRFAKRPTELGLPDIGDLETNLNPMSRVPHSTFHTEMRYQGSYQFPGQKLEISKQNLASELAKVKNFKDLETLWDEMLKGDIKYLVETNKMWEKADEAIKSVSPEYTGTARYKPPTKK